MEDNLKGMTAGQLLHHLMDHFQSPEEQGYQLLDHAYKHLNPSRVKVCALTGCGRKVGLPPWTIAGRPEEYCSHACTDIAFQAGKKARQGVQVPAQDFGGLLTRLKCDVCGNPVLINWGRSIGKDCCSRECQKKAEEDSMTTENETTDTTTTDPKPITAGAAAPAKKSGKKVASKASSAKAKKPAKKAPAKTKAPATEDGTVRSGSNMEILLKMVQKVKGASLDEMAKTTGWEKDMCARTLNNLKRKGVTIVRGEDARYTSPK